MTQTNTHNVPFLSGTVTIRGKEDFSGSVDGAGYKGSMDDTTKRPLTQIPPTFTDGVAAVLQYGAKKYSRGNWMRGMSWSEVLDATKRHIAAFERGETNDPESKLPHLDHAACNLAFLSWYQFGHQVGKHAAFDDRLFAPPAPTATITGVQFCGASLSPTTAAPIMAANGGPEHDTDLCPCIGCHRVRRMGGE